MPRKSKFTKPPTNADRDLLVRANAVAAHTEFLRYNCDHLDAVSQDASRKVLTEITDAIDRLRAFQRLLTERALEGTTPLDSADKVLLRKVFDVGPYIAKPDDKDRTRLDRLVLDGYLSAWLANANAMMYAITDLGRVILKQVGK